MNNNVSAAKKVQTRVLAYQVTKEIPKEALAQVAGGSWWSSCVFSWSFPASGDVRCPL